VVEFIGSFLITAKGAKKSMKTGGCWFYNILNREVLKSTVEDAFLFQPLKSQKDAKEAGFFGGFSRLFAVKINF
jgi:hypothetical protein